MYQPPKLSIPYLRACETGTEDSVRAILQHTRVNVNAPGPGGPALHLAVSVASLPKLRLLLGHPRVELSVRDARGLTCLSLAINLASSKSSSDDDLEAVQAILAHPGLGDNINLPCKVAFGGLHHSPPQWPPQGYECV